METQRDSIFYKFQQYDIEIKLINQKRLAISIIDPVLMVQYAEKDLTLENIGSSTLCQAFQGKSKDIQILVNYKHFGEVLEFTINLDTKLFKIDQNIYIKKLKNVSQSKILLTKIKHLNKQLKTKGELNKNQEMCLVGLQLQQKNYIANTGNNFHHMCKIQLPKGNYLLTCSFLLKAQSQFFYIFFGYGEQLLQNSSFYVPTCRYFVPHQFRKIHIVTAQKQTASFATYYSGNHPAIIRNAIITAKRIDI